MSGYIGNIPVPQATQTRDVFTATSGQTTFATSGYTPGFLDVWLNGVKLVNGTDFTATNGSDVVLTSGAATDDIVEVLSYSTYEVNAQTYTGGLTAKNDGAAAITADRLSSDGAVIDLKKDGTTVGSIGTEGGDLTIGTGDTGLQFADGGDYIRPWNTSTNSGRDNAVDLGVSTTRFKNLYLSGGVYLGGTGSANLLDDYETGTWTPIFQSSIDGTITEATYTKIGQLVRISCEVLIRRNTSDSTGLQISGLPFAVTGYGTASLYRFEPTGWAYQVIRPIIVGSGIFFFRPASSTNMVSGNETNNNGTVLAVNDVSTTTNVNLQGVILQGFYIV